MAIRLLATDLDFTLLNENREVTADAIQAVREAEAAGIQVVLASGRIASSMEHYAEELGLTTPLISCNGAFVVDGRGEAITKHQISQSFLRRIVEICQSRSLYCQVYSPAGVFFPEENDWSRMYMNRVKRAKAHLVGWEGLKTVEALKLIVLSEPETVTALQEEFSGTFLDEGIQTTISEPEYFEFLSAKADKGSGLASVAEHLGVRQEETAAIGDYFNDLPMLLWAGHSAAVANAPTEVKDKADWIAPRNTEGGVSAYIRHLLQNLEQTNGLPVRP